MRSNVAIPVEWKPADGVKFPAAINEFLPRFALPSPFSVCRGEYRMTNIELFRRRAEECLRKANAVSDRHRARLLLVEAHNQLKSAEELEAEQLTARDR
jgi:hypothetical protein